MQRSRLHSADRPTVMRVFSCCTLHNMRQNVNLERGARAYQMATVKRYDSLSSESHACHSRACITHITPRARFSLVWDTRVSWQGGVWRGPAGGLEAGSDFGTNKVQIRLVELNAAYVIILNYIFSWLYGFYIDLQPFCLSAILEALCISPHSYAWKCHNCRIGRARWGRRERGTDKHRFYAIVALKAVCRKRTDTGSAQPKGRERDRGRNLLLSGSVFHEKSANSDTYSILLIISTFLQSDRSTWRW